jgi:uncharacterized phage protein gp47/JayE
VFSPLTPIYLLECREENKPVKDILKIEGFFKGEKHIFQKAKDYRLRDSMVEWLGNNSNQPDDKSHFTVTYLFSNGQAGLTDANVGSVLRTIVEATSREIELLYEEMDQVYHAGFIDTAQAKALDLVVSILGIKRKAPTHAYGIVTFLKDNDPPEITVSEAILYDGREIYELKTGPVKRIITIKGNIENHEAAPYVFLDSKDFILENNCVRWLDTENNKGQKPIDKTEFSVEYVAYQKITVSSGTIVSTPAKESQHARFFQTKKDGTLIRNSDGKWETNVEAEALDAGANGNVLAGLINVMPKPPVGIDKVINRSNMAGGADAEDDNYLRERAKKVLDVKGKATLESLRTAIEGVEGIGSSPVMIDMPDGVPGIVKVIVDGGDDKEIDRVLENTRAAGIKVEFERPRIVLLDINVTLVVGRKIVAATDISDKVTRLVESQIRNFVSSLKIGENIITNQLVSHLIGMPDVRDVAELDIRAYRGRERETKTKEKEEGQDGEVETGGESSITSPAMKTSKTTMAAATTPTTSTTSTKIKENVTIEADERPYVRTVSVKFKVGK